MRRSLAILVALPLLGGCLHVPASLSLLHKSAPSAPPATPTAVCPGSFRADVPEIPKIPDAAGFKGYLNPLEYSTLAHAGIPEIAPEIGKQRFDVYVTWLTQTGRTTRTLHDFALEVKTWCDKQTAPP